MMKKSLKKTTALILAAAMLSLSPAYVVAAKTSTTNTETGEWKPFDFSYTKDPNITNIPMGHAYIPKETVLNVELVNELSSKKAKKGDMVTLRTMENIIINDVIVIPAGATVMGEVTKATRAGGFGRAGKLEIMITETKSVNGVRIPLEFVSSREESHDGGAIAVAAAVSLVGGIFMKGKNVTYPAGTKFAAKVSTDTDLNVTLEELPEAMNPNKPHGVSITIK